MRWLLPGLVVALTAVAQAAPAQTASGGQLTASGPERPPAPASAQKSAPSPAIAPAAARAWIDTGDRSAVAAAYNAAFNSPEPPPGWTGNIPGCVPGTLAADHRAAIMDRVNWYRGMAGVLDGVTEHAPFSADSQAAALMAAANDQLNHTPPSTWACFSDSGYYGSSKSNLCLDCQGRAGIDLFMNDPGANNAPVGHRWWFLHPNQVRMGVGSIPGAVWHDRAMAIFVVDDQNFFPPTPPPIREPGGFVAWPPRGFVPQTTVFPRWSLFREGADFSAAAVQVSVNGVNRPVALEYTADRLTFIPTLDPFPVNGDVAVTVTVTGIAGAGVPTTFSWTTTVIPPPTVSAAPKPVSDFNGDGKTDFGVYRRSNGGWYVALAGGGATSASWGTTGDVPAPGDYNGDGKTDFGIYRPSTGGWYVALTGGGGTSATWGAPGDVPVPGDYNGDGKTDFGIYRPSNGSWYVAFAGGGVTSASWGATGDVPVPGDYNGDGRTDFGIFRPSNGGWYVALAGGGATSASWGTTGDVPVPGDYNGDGRTDFGIYRPSTGGWYVALTGGGGASASWGAAGDIPLPLPYAVWQRFYGA